MGVSRARRLLRCCWLGGRSRVGRGRGSCWLFEPAVHELAFHSIPLRGDQSDNTWQNARHREDADTGTARTVEPGKLVEAEVGADEDVRQECVSEVATRSAKR